jgi:hypothetical protein
MPEPLCSRPSSTRSCQKTLFQLKPSCSRHLLAYFCYYSVACFLSKGGQRLASSLSHFLSQELVGAVWRRVQ